MKNTTYDNLKMIALIVAPIMTFVATILKIWNVPYSTQILATLSALDVLVGSIVAVANELYKKSKTKNKGKKK
jgi:hypothetical protein